METHIKHLNTCKKGENIVQLEKTGTTRGARGIPPPEENVVNFVWPTLKIK